MQISPGTISATGPTVHRGAAASADSTPIAGVFAWIALCLRRSRERNELRQLGSRERRDIGYGRVLDEEAKPFWRD